MKVQGYVIPMEAKNDDLKIGSLVRSMRRTISLSVKPDGSLEVKAPHLVPMPVIHRFIREKQDWIKKARERMSESRPREHAFIEGEHFLLLGETYGLHLTDGNSVTTLGKQLFFPRRFMVSGKQEMRKWYVKQARKTIEPMMRRWGEKIGVSYNAVSIRDAYTRWGSCSTSGTISFSWRLIMAPLPVVEYVVIHELCHVRHHDHSHAFWNEVFRYCPQYRTHRTWLHRNGNTLTV